MISPNRLSSVVGLDGFGKIWFLDRWLRPDFVPPSPFLGLRIRLLKLLGFWLSLISSMLSSEMLVCLFSAGLVILLSHLISSWTLLVISCLRSLFLIFPGVRGGTCRRLLGLKSLLPGGLDGWAWNEVKALPSPWFSGLAILLDLVETTGLVTPPRLAALRFLEEACYAFVVAVVEAELLVAGNLVRCFWVPDGKLAGTPTSNPESCGWRLWVQPVVYT